MDALQLKPVHLQTLASILARKGYSTFLERQQTASVLPFCSDATQTLALVFLASKKYAPVSQWVADMKARAQPPVKRILLVAPAPEDARYYRGMFPEGKIGEGATFHAFCKTDMALDLAACEDQPAHELVTAEQAGIRCMENMPLINLEDPAIQQMLGEPDQMVRVSYGYDNGAEDFNYFRIIATRVADRQLASLRKGFVPKESIVGNDKTQVDAADVVPGPTSGFARFQHRQALLHSTPPRANTLPPRVPPAAADSDSEMSVEIEGQRIRPWTGYVDDAPGMVDNLPYALEHVRLGAVDDARLTHGETAVGRKHR